MEKMASCNPEGILTQLSGALMEEVEKIKGQGRFNYYKKNCFTYIKVSDEFSSIPTEILRPHGYQGLSIMKKQNSPRTHISVLTSVEQRKTSRDKLHEVWNKWRSIDIPFKITSVEIWLHTSKETGARTYLCGYLVSSPIIEEIRVDLGWKPKQKYYNMHISTCEKPI